MKEKRKMAFYEIGRGQLGRDIQAQFEKAQSIAVEREVDVKVKLEITIHKPSEDEEEWIRSVSYIHELKQPPMKSPKHGTVHENNLIVRDAQESPEQLTMLDLDINKPNTVDFRQGKTVNGEE